jgi:hypothetical protein
VACLEHDFEACIAYLHVALGHRPGICTTQYLLERLFGEERHGVERIMTARLL